MLRKWQLSHNRSMDGVLDQLHSKDLTEGGFPIQVLHKTRRFFFLNQIKIVFFRTFKIVPTMIVATMNTTNLLQPHFLIIYRVQRYLACLCQIRGHILVLNAAYNGLDFIG